MFLSLKNLFQPDKLPGPCLTRNTKNYDMCCAMEQVIQKIRKQNKKIRNYGMCCAMEQVLFVKEPGNPLLSERLIKEN